MKVRRRLVAVLAVVCGAVGLAAVAVPAADAASGPIFTVMNTSESLPDGVYFRNSPHTADTSRITGLGVFKNERVQLQCYAFGDAVGAFNDKLWYRVNNVTRPTVGGRANVGYLNAHYINDGKNANVVDAGVPKCGAAPTSPPNGGAVYYSPYGAGSHIPNASTSIVRTISDGDWKAGSSCSSSNASSHTPGSVGGKTVSVLAGWSLGRVGVLYELEALKAQGQAKLAAIKYVLMIDPGSYAELRGSCDTSVGSVLAAWLKATPDAHLVVLSGPDTLDSTHPVNGFGSAGIQNYYFNAIRNADSGGNLRSRVLVCNYTDPRESVSQSHQTIYKNASYLIGKPRITTCPAISGMTSDGHWNP